MSAWGVSEIANKTDWGMMNDSDDEGRVRSAAGRQTIQEGMPFRNFLITQKED